MCAASHRMERLAEQVRAEIARIIGEELNDPRIGFATVTRVDVTSDLEHARVRVSVLGDEQAVSASLEGLNSAAGYMRREMGRRLRLRRTPDLTFFADHGPEESIRLDQLLQRLQSEKEST